MAHLRRRPRQHALRAARSDQPGQLQEARGRVALQDRRARAAARVQPAVHAADGRRRAVFDRRHPSRRRCARCRHRRDALDAQPERRPARRGGAAAAVGPRTVVLERRPRRADPLRHAGLPDGRARREDRRARRRLRQERHRRSQAGLRSGAVDLDQRRGRPARGAGHRQGRRHHRRGVRDRRQSEEQDEHQGLRARVRRPHGQAAVGVPHDSAARASWASTRGEATPRPTPGTPACGRR